MTTGRADVRSGADRSGLWPYGRPVRRAPRSHRVPIRDPSQGSSIVRLPYYLRGPPPMSLRALARFCYRRRRLVVLLWVVALVGVNVLSGALGTNFSTNFSAPHTESTRASDLLAANFKAQSGDAVQVVMQGSPSMRTPDVQRQAEEFIAA